MTTPPDAVQPVPEYLPTLEELVWGYDQETYRDLSHQYGLQVMMHGHPDCRMVLPDDTSERIDILLRYLLGRVHFATTTYVDALFPATEDIDGGFRIPVNLVNLSHNARSISVADGEAYSEHMLETRAKAAVATFLRRFHPDNADAIIERLSLIIPESGDMPVRRVAQASVLLDVPANSDDGYTIEDIVGCLKGEVLLCVEFLVEHLKRLDGQLSFDDILRDPQFQLLLEDAIASGIEEAHHILDIFLIITNAICESEGDLSKLSDYLAILSTYPNIAA